MPSLKRIINLSLLIASSRLLSAGTNFVGMILLARQGGDSLAASALISVVQMFFLISGMSLLFSVSPIASQHFGAKKNKEIGDILHHALFLSLFISGLLMILFWFVEPILQFFHQPATLLPSVGHYFKAFVFAVPAIMIITTLQQILISIHKQLVAVFMDVINLGLTGFIGFILIYGKLGLPALGLDGLAYASVIRAWTVVIGILFYLGSNQGLKIYKFTKKFSFSKKIFGSLLTIGWPIFINLSGEMISLFAISIMVGWVSIEAINAYQIASQYLLLQIVPLFGISQATSIIVSYCVGNSQYDSIRKTVNIALKIGLWFTFLALVLFISFSKLFISVFLDITNPMNAYQISFTTELFIIVMIGQFFDSIRNISIGGLQGLQITRQPMLISLGFIWGISIPLSYIMGFILHKGLIGIAIGGNIALLFASFFIYRLWLKESQFYENNRLMERRVTVLQQVGLSN